MKRLMKDSGQGLIEFAIVVPILLIFLLGILEFGWLLNAQITMTSAAREGARTAVVSSFDRENRAFDAANRAVEGVSGILLIDDPEHFRCYEETDVVNNVLNIVVELKGEVKPIVGIFVDDPFIIHGRAVMRLE